MKKNESNPESNLLIDCTYIKDNNDLSDSLAFYGCRLIKGFLRYGHYTIHVLLWRDIEARLDNLVGEPFDKIILDKDEIPARYLRSYNRLRGLLPPGLKDELRRRSIQKVLLPSHYNSFFHFLHPFTQYTVVHAQMAYS